LPVFLIATALVSTESLSNARRPPVPLVTTVPGPRARPEDRSGGL